MPPKKETSPSKKQIDRLVGKLSQEYKIAEDVVEDKLKQIISWNSDRDIEDKDLIYYATDDDLITLSQSFETDQGKEIHAIKASESVVSATRYDRVKHQNYVEHRLKSSSDRAPPPFNGTDGDHRTAIGYIKEGFLSLLQGLKLDSKDGVDSLKNEKRGQIYDYISAVAMMDTSERRQALYEGINNALADYNMVRLKKQQIESIKNSINPEQRQVIVEKMREINATQALESLSQIYQVFMTFVNQMPNSYVKISEREATTDEGPRVERVNNFFNRGLSDDSISKLKSEIEETEKTLTQEKARTRPRNTASLTRDLQEKKEQYNKQLLEKIIQNLSDVFFYLEIPETLLAEHRKSTVEGFEAKLKKMFNKDVIRDLYVRDNSIEKLISAMAHHLNITFIRHPEILQAGFAKDDIIDNFIDRVISGNHSVRNQVQPVQGWPTIAKDPSKVEEVKNKVKDKLKSLHDALFIDSENKGVDHYTSNSGYEDVKSSRGSAARSRAGSDSDGASQRLQDVQGSIGLGRFGNEELIEDLKRRLGGDGISLKDKDLTDQLSVSLEGKKEFERENILKLLRDLKITMDRRHSTTKKEFVLSFNEAIEEELGIKNIINQPLKGDDYSSMMADIIKQVDKNNTNPNISKNELSSIIASKCVSGNIVLGTKSFVERIQSKTGKGSNEL